jgi:YaiO family outer membrane protein
MTRFALALLAAALLAAPAARAQQGLRIDLEGYHQEQRLTRGLPHWRDTGLRLELQEPTRRGWFGQLRETRRFSLRDTEGSAGLYQPFGDGWAASFNLTASDTHAVLPKYSLLAQGEKQLGGGWGVHFGLRRSEYTFTHADLRLLTLERYIGDHRLAYTFYSGQPEGGGSAPSHRLQWSYFFGDQSSVGLSLARGREVENVGGGALVTSDVRNVTLFGRWWFAPHWAISAEAETHEQGNLYRRHGLRIGLRHRF